MTGQMRPCLDGAARGAEQAEGLDGRPRPLPRLRPCLTSAAWLFRLNTTGVLSRQPRAPCRGAGGRPLRRGLRVPAHAVTRFVLRSLCSAAPARASRPRQDLCGCLLRPWPSGRALRIASRCEGCRCSLAALAAAPLVEVLQMFPPVRMHKFEHLGILGKGSLS